MRDWLVDRLTAQASSPDLLAGDHTLNGGWGDWRPPRDGRQASVLVPLVEREHDYSILLTRRTDHLPDHAGQVAFPGGSREDQDRDAIDTALREAEEEVGLSRSYVDVITTLDIYQTGTGFHITPVVGLVRPGFTLRADPAEVATIFEVPLVHVLDINNHQTQTRRWKGIDRSFYVIDWEDQYIWGATAAMLVNLSRLLGEVPTPMLMGQGEP